MAATVAALIDYIDKSSSVYIKLVLSILLTSSREVFLHVSSMYFFFYILDHFSFRLLQFGQILSNCVPSNLFCTNYYRMKFDNLFYCSLKFKMNKKK